MERSLLPALPMPRPAWKLDQSSRYTIEGLEYRLAESAIEGVHSFRRLAEPHSEASFSQAEIEAMHEDGRLEIDNAYFGRRRAYLRSTGRDIDLSDMSPSEQERMWFTYHLCTGYELCLGAYESGKSKEKVTTGKVCLAKLLPRLKAEIVAAHNTRARSGDRLLFDRKLPSAKTFARHLASFRQARSAAAFARLYRGSSSRATKADPMELRERSRCQRSWLSPKRPTIAFVFRKYRSRIRLLNKWLVQKGRPRLETVCYNTFAATIKDFDAFHACCVREGEKTALARFATGTGGFGAFRPLERVEVDSWKIDLMTILVETNAWQHMTPKQQAAAKRARLWATVAIDVGTRVVLSAVIREREPNSDTAVEMIELAMTDKAALGDAIGASCSLPYAGLIESVEPDNGAPFKGGGFKAAVHDAGAELLLPKAGMPRARAHVERQFRTQSVTGLSWFGGRTFSNVVELGEADPRVQATAFAFDFARGFMRHMLEGYNHSPHSGLGGETPNAAWLRLTAKHPVSPPLTPRRRRHIFGLEFERIVSSQGIRFLGFEYNSPDVQAMHGKTATFRIDRFSIHAISFWNGKSWIEAPAVLPIPRGLTVHEVEYAAARFRERFADHDGMHMDYVDGAAREMRELGIAFDRMHGIDPVNDRTAERERLDRLDRERFGFTIGRGRMHLATTPPVAPLLDLTQPEADADDRVYDTPPAYEAVHQPERPDRYSESRKNDGKGAPAANEGPSPDDAPGTFDDPDAIDF